MQECGLYKLYAKVLKVTRKIKWHLRTDILNYRYYCWPLGTSCFYHVVLPLRGFLMLIYWPILLPAYHYSAQSCPTCLHATLRQSGSCPSDHCLPTKTNLATLAKSFYLQPNTEAREIFKNVLAKTPSPAFYALLCKVVESGSGIWPDAHLNLGQHLRHHTLLAEPLIHTGSTSVFRVKLSAKLIITTVLARTTTTLCCNGSK